MQVSYAKNPMQNEARPYKIQVRLASNGSQRQTTLILIIKSHWRKTTPAHTHIRYFPLCTGGAPLWESKKLICLRPRKWDCCSDLFCQNWRGFNEPQCFCKSNRMAGSRGTRLLIEDLWPRCMLLTFAKAPCCLELFGCCCRRLSQHGVGEVLIPLQHCWRDAFSAFALAWQGTWEQIRTKILKAFGGMMAGPW